MTLAKVKNFIEFSLDWRLFCTELRELTQSWTQLQNQIERFGDHVFKHGSMVIPGNIGLDLEYYAVKLTSISSSNTLDSIYYRYIINRWYFRCYWLEIVNTAVIIWFWSRYSLCKIQQNWYKQYNCCFFRWWNYYRYK